MRVQFFLSVNTNLSYLFMNQSSLHGQHYYMVETTCVWILQNYYFCVPQKRKVIQVWNKHIRVCEWFICCPFYLTFTCSGTHTAYLTWLHGTWLSFIALHLSVWYWYLKSCMHLIALGSLEWCHLQLLSACEKRHLFVWKSREPLYLHKNIHAVEFVRWSTWQIHLLSLMSLSSSSYQQ